MNVKRFLEKCDLFTAPVDIKNCFVDNQVRYGFDKLPNFNPQLKLRMELGDTLNRPEKYDVLKVCMPGILRIDDFFVSLKFFHWF